MLRKILSCTLCLTLMLLMGLMLACPALAESAERLVILLDGKPVTEAVLNLSESRQLQFTANMPVTWKSSKDYRATIDSSGRLNALSSSTVVITATAADGQKATCEVRMARLATALQISGPDALAAGRSGKLTATVLPKDAANRKVTWTSSNPNVVSVSSSGAIRAKNVSGVQSAVITATARDGSGVTASHTVTVTPAVSKVEIVRGDQAVKTVYLDIASPTAQLSARTLPANASQGVSWKSSSTKTVTVDENGVLRGLRTGSATITAAASDGSGKKATVKVYVVRPVSSIAITGNSEVMAGKSLKLKAKVSPANASEDEVTWSSSDPSVARVDKYGKVTAQKVSGVRSAVITATAKDGSGVTAQHTVTVTPAVTTLQITQAGKPVSDTVMLDITASPTLQLGTLIAPADASQSVKWTVSSSARARIDQNGLLTGLKTGSVTVTAAATDGSGKKDTVKVKIVRAVTGITVTGDTALGGGQSGKLKAVVTPSNASEKDVTWKSSDPSVVSVNKYGSLKAAKVTSTRQVIITATAKDGSGVTGQATITVTPRAAKIVLKHEGETVNSTLGIDLGGVRTLRLSAVVEPADAKQQVRWATSSSKRATVDQNGVVTAHAKGKVTITAAATDGSGLKASCTIEIGTMVRTVSITGSNEVATGRKIELDARVAPASSTNKKVVWSSSNPTAATVSKYGVVTGGVVDTPTQVTITATAADGGGAVGHHVITVKPMARSVSISRADARMARGLILNTGSGRARLSASISPAAAAQSVSWSSSNSKVVSVDQNGNVTAGRAGTAYITATAKDGSGVKSILWVGVGDLDSLPYYFEVDRANQVVRVYARGSDYTYSTLIKRMICSTGRLSSQPDNRMYAMAGGRMVWMDGVAIYATRINGPFLFHSVTYTAKRMNALDATQYRKLGTPASAGCFRLLAGDAKWIYDNVPKGCFVNVMVGVRDVKEYGSVSKPELVSGKWDPTNPHPDNPDFDPTYTSDVQ